ncbi:cytochrome P450 [Neobacillus niacini]|uniref:cytochrome P450 n=1 Tax=Neobacillus niacini TaxID=86668 RepID=UPI0028584443|nr:cytochrome P450 [Neobacillus niacini]MDR7076141.1 cytochrome P450 [Neobacillus niacini]
MNQSKTKYNFKFRWLPMKELRSNESRSNPFPIFKMLRENSPIRWDEERGTWDVFRYKDIYNILQQPMLFNSLPSPAFGDGTTVVTMNPPQHKKYRDLLNKLFTPREMRKLEGRIRDIVVDLIHETKDKDEIDIVKDLAEPLPLYVIADILGIPVEKRKTLKELSMTAFGSSESATEEDLAQFRIVFAEALGQLRIILEEAIEEKRRNPQNDLISKLIDAEIDGKRMPEEHLIGNCLLLLAAGNETTTNLISSGVRVLIEQPNIEEQLRNDSSLIPKHVEETLRYYSPVKTIFRKVTEDMEFNGHHFKKGDPINTWLMSANLDEEIYEDAHLFKLDRKFTKHPHMAFGNGIHFCLGAPLARLEAQIVFKVLLDMFPKIEMIPETEWQTVASEISFGLKTLRLRNF